MSLDLSAVRAAISTGLLVAGLHSAAHIGAVKRLPAAVVGNVEGIEYSQTYAGTVKVTLPLWVIVARTNEDAAVRALDGYVSIGTAKSIYTALRNLAPTAWRSLSVLSTGPYGSITVNNAEALAVSFNLSITA